MRFQIIGTARITNVGKSQSCMVSTLPIIWKQTVLAIACVVAQLTELELHRRHLSKQRVPASPAVAGLTWISSDMRASDM